MKYIILILITLCLGCKQKEQIAQASEDTISNPVEKMVTKWLTMNGDGKMPHVVLISGDEEYRSEEAMPQLAKILSERHGFKCTVLSAQDPSKPGVIDPNYVENIEGLEHLATADMMVIFTRFRALPDHQMKYIDEYLESGKPVLGIRTSTHAFHFTEDHTDSNYKHYGNFYDGDDEWKDGFGKLVLGEHWISHHGHHGHQSTRGILATGSENHPILNGIADGDIWGPTDVYGVRLPLLGDVQPLVFGQVVNRPGEQDVNDPLLGMRPTDSELPGAVLEEDGGKVKYYPNNPMMPIAWIKTYRIPDGLRGKVFATTIGSSTDLLSQGVRRMMVNAVYWGVNKTVPEAANVDIIGQYEPTKFAFQDDAYWDRLNVSISSLAN